MICSGTPAMTCFKGAGQDCSLRRQERNGGCLGLAEGASLLAKWVKLGAISIWTKMERTGFVLSKEIMFARKHMHGGSGCLGSDTVHIHQNWGSWFQSCK